MKYLKSAGFGKASMETDIQTELSHITKKIVKYNKPVVTHEIFSVSVMNILWKSVAGEVEWLVRLQIFCAKINITIFKLYYSSK